MRPSSASPAAMPVSAASLTPSMKKRPGRSRLNWSKVPIPRSEPMKTMRSSDRASSYTTSRQVLRIGALELRREARQLGFARIVLVMPMHVVLDEAHTLAFDRVTDDRRRLAGTERHAPQHGPK